MFCYLLQKQISKLRKCKGEDCNNLWPMSRHTSTILHSSTTLSYRVHHLTCSLWHCVNHWLLEIIYTDYLYCYCYLPKHLSYTYKRFNRHPPNKDKYISNIVLSFTFHTTTLWLLKVEMAQQNCCTIESTDTEESQVSSQVWTKPGSQADTARKCWVGHNNNIKYKNIWCCHNTNIYSKNIYLFAMNHSEEFGRVTWAGANMAPSWTSSRYIYIYLGFPWSNQVRIFFC